MNDVPDTLAPPVFDRPVKVLIVAAGGGAAVQATLSAAQTALADATVELVWMPSVAEIACAISLAERMADFDGYVAIGLICGDGLTAEVEAREVTGALTSLGLRGAMVGNGVLIDEDSVHLIKNATTKGAQAGAAALHLIALSRKWATDTKGIGFRP